MKIILARILLCLLIVQTGSVLYGSESRNERWKKEHEAYIIKRDIVAPVLCLVVTCGVFHLIELSEKNGRRHSYLDGVKQGSAQCANHRDFLISDLDHYAQSFATRHTLESPVYGAFDAGKTQGSIACTAFLAQKPQTDCTPLITKSYEAGKTQGQIACNALLAKKVKPQHKKHSRPRLSKFLYAMQPKPEKCFDKHRHNGQRKR